MSPPLRLQPDDAGLAMAADLLRRGGIVAFPTETVYGLGARADRSAAVRRIYEAKGRPAENPSIVHVASLDAARRVARLDPIACALAEAFWPGPLTLVATRVEGAISDATTSGGRTVAVRIPSHPIALALLERVDLPIAAPSANRSQHVSPTTADHVARSLGDRVDAIVDGGAAQHGIESTIVRAIEGEPLAVLRLGALPLAAIAAFASPRVVVDASRRIDAEGVAAAAPGGQARHYAPHASLVVSPRDELGRWVDLVEHGAKVGVIAVGSTPGHAVDEIVLAPDAAAYAAGLYAALHELEARGCSAIVVERVPDGDAWSAVRDRLRRASVPRP